MKWFSVIILFALTNAVFADNRMDQMETYKEIQRLVKIADKKEEALTMIASLVSKLKKDDPLYKELSDLRASLTGNDSGFPLEKAIKFGTGAKEEIYCQDVGLVYIKANHNDGTVSELKLISSNREMVKGSYSQMKKGDWVYELDTAYRKPILSDSWLDEATLSSYRLREVRSTNKDNGKWSAHWVGKSTSSSYSTTGDTPEPLPMHLANDYHLWGENDLGFKLKFEKGYKDTISGRESGSSKTLILKTRREVLEKLPEFSYKDSKEKEYKHSSCFKVSAIVELDKLEDNK